MAIFSTVPRPRPVLGQTGALGHRSIVAWCLVRALHRRNPVEGRGLIRDNVEALGPAGAAASSFRRDATRLAKRARMTPFDLLLADPPYGTGLGEKALASATGRWVELAPHAVCVVEEAANFSPGGRGRVRACRRRLYGDTATALSQACPLTLVTLLLSVDADVILKALGADASHAPHLSDKAK